MRIGDVNVSTTEQNLGLWHDDLTRGADASVDVTDARKHVRTPDKLFRQAGVNVAANR